VGLFGLLLLGFSMGAILVLRGLPVSLFIKKKNWDSFDDKVRGWMGKRQGAGLFIKRRSREEERAKGMLLLGAICLCFVCTYKDRICGFSYTNNSSEFLG
jgi:hypothetical protein